MPKFSQQRILKSKEVLCSYFNKKFDNFLFEQKIKEEAYNRTLLLADENSDEFKDILKSNESMLINSYIKMSVPKIRNRFESGYALFKPDIKLFENGEENSQSFFIFNETEMIEYILNRQLLYLQQKPWRYIVRRFYKFMDYEVVANMVNIKSSDLIDEIEYVKSSFSIMSKEDNIYIPYALMNCNKFRDFIKHILDLNNDFTIMLFKSIEQHGIYYGSLGSPAEEYTYYGNKYYIVSFDEDYEIDDMSNDFNLVLKK